MLFIDDGGSMQQQRHSNVFDVSNNTFMKKENTFDCSKQPKRQGLMIATLLSCCSQLRNAESLTEPAAEAAFVGRATGMINCLHNSYNMKITSNLIEITCYISCFCP